MEDENFILHSKHCCDFPVRCTDTYGHYKNVAVNGLNKNAVFERSGFGWVYSRRLSVDEMTCMNVTLVTVVNPMAFPSLASIVIFYNVAVQIYSSVILCDWRLLSLCRDFIFDTVPCSLTTLTNQ